jgi:hypothetical protein
LKRERKKAQAERLLASNAVVATHRWVGRTARDVLDADFCGEIDLFGSGKASSGAVIANMVLGGAPLTGHSCSSTLRRAAAMN